MITINRPIEIRFFIEGFEGYGIGHDLVMYNLNTGRRLKQCMNNACIGYWFGKKFVSIKRLQTIKYKVR